MHKMKNTKIMLRKQWWSLFLNHSNKCNILTCMFVKSVFPVQIYKQTFLKLASDVPYL